MEASVIRRRMKKSEVQALKARKMKDIEKKIVYMRAASPPPSLFRTSSRKNSISFKEPPVFEIDQRVKAAVLKDEVYNQLKRTLKGEASGLQTENSFVSDVSQTPALSAPESPSSFSCAEWREERPSSLQNKVPDRVQEIASELSRRGLTSSASRRKLQAEVKVQIESQFTSGVSNTPKKSVIANAGRNALGF